MQSNSVTVSRLVSKSKHRFFLFFLSSDSEVSEFQIGEYLTTNMLLFLLLF